MDFVTITDHDTIAGVLEIADRPDVFVSEELTATLPRTSHRPCTCSATASPPEDHEWLQANRGDVELLRGLLYEREIACALAHPYYTVAAPLTARHRRRLAELFGVWEVRNGARARELNRPAATYVATRDGIGIGGSDDHAGVDIGRTFTETPPAASPAEFLAHVRAGDVAARGAQGSAAKWAHAAIALAVRSLGAAPADGPAERPDPGRVMSMVRRLLREADARQGAAAGEVSPRGRALPAARRGCARWSLDDLDERGLIAHMQARGLQPRRPVPRACRAHERKLRAAVDVAVAAARGEADLRQRRGGALRRLHRGDPLRAGRRLPGATSRPSSRRSPTRSTRSAGSRRPGGRRRRAADRDPRRRDRLDPRGDAHDRGDPRARRAGLRDRGASAPTRRWTGGSRPSPTSRSPSTPGCASACRACPAAVRGARGRRRFDAIHVCSPGPAGIAGALRRAGAWRCPLLGSYHTELTAYAGTALGRAGASPRRWRWRSCAFYGACDLVLSPSPASDRALAAIGIAPSACCAGTAASTRRASTRRSARTTVLRGRDQRPLLRADHAREGRRAARRRLPRGARSRDPRLHLRARRRRARAGARCASASASARASSAGSRATSSRAPTRAPTCSCSRAPPTPSAR